MIDLQDVLKKHPDCLSSADKLKAYMTDFYPSEKAKIAIIVAIFSSGIAKEIKETNNIDDIMVSSYCTRLENSYGFSPKLSNECIRLWINAYEKTIPAPTKTIVNSLQTESYLTTSPNKANDNVNIIKEAQKDESYKQTRNTHRITPSNINDFAILGGILKKYIGKCSEIVIPDSVKSIGEGAFHGCSVLTSIVIPDGVTSIGWGAFKDCGSLTSITIPDSVKSIGNYAFWGCSSLTNIKIESGVTSIGERAFGNCQSLTSITIPGSVKSIGKEAFWECSSLTSITIPCSVTSIEKGAFSGCRSLTSITIPNNVRSIGEDAFCNCRSLTSITIPDSVRSIGNYAFWGCNGLTSITIPNGVTNIGKGIFHLCRNLESISVGCENAFYISNNNCIIDKKSYSLITWCKSSTIPYGVEKIGCSAFSKCAITSITLPSSIVCIDSEAFLSCPELTSITIPSSVNNIGWRAFFNCNKLTSITIPSSVKNIGNESFEKCDNLVIYTPYLSPAYEYARKKGIPCYESPGAKLISERIERGVCIYCGGKFKGLFTKKCSVCGKKRIIVNTTTHI